MGATRRWLIYLGCFLGLAFALLAYAAQWRYSEFPPDFDASALSYPVRIGSYAADSPTRLGFLAESWPPGTTIAITESGGARHDVELVLRQGPIALVVTGLSGLVFLAVAIFFFAPRSDRPGGGDFFCISFFYGLAIMVGGIYFPRERAVLTTAFGLTQAACLAALPTVLVHLALTFPRRSAFLARRRWPMPALGAAAAAIFLWQAVVLLRYFLAPTIANGGFISPAVTAADLFLVALTFAGVVIFATRSRNLETTRERKQLGWLLWGFSIGAAPYVLLRTVPDLLGLAPLMPDYVDRLVELAIPFAFIMVVVRHQFLDIDVIIRRSLLYGLLTTALIGVYLVAGIVFGRWLDMPGEFEVWIPPVILGLGAGMAFQPLRRRLGRWIDLAFFKLSFDRDLVLESLGDELGRLEARQPLAEALRRRIDRVLLPERSAVVIIRAEGPILGGELRPELAGEVLAYLADAGHTRLAAAPQSTSRPDAEDDRFPQGLRDAGFVLAQPLPVQDRVGGVILVGRRATERRWVEPDLEFLTGCARIAALNLERIGLIKTVAEEIQAREQLAEIHRLKSEFLSHVAHDLRTPVTGITWSARNLIDGVVGPLTSEQVEYAHSIAQSGEHLNRLVSNLLEISRLDRAEPNLDLGPLAPVLIWQQSLRTIRPLALAKNVTLSLAGEEHGATVRGNPGKLAEVAVNLLDNAVKYTAPGTTVTVELQPPADGVLAVSVRDQGPGLRDQTLDSLVARFAQGVPSPNSNRKGFGLGLYIAVTYLELMGGRLTARDHPDGGAEFTCRLPLTGIASPGCEEGDAP